MGMTPVMREKQDIFRALNPAVINLTKLLLPLVPVTSTLYFVISITTPETIVNYTIVPN